MHLQSSRLGVIDFCLPSINNGIFPLSYPFADGKLWNHYTAPLVSEYVVRESNLKQWMEGKSINGCPCYPDEPDGPYGYRTRSSSYIYNYHLGLPNISAGKLYISKAVNAKSLNQLLVITDARYPAKGGFSILPGQAEDIGLNHRDGFNALFGDGHVETRRIIENQNIYPN